MQDIHNFNLMGMENSDSFDSPAYELWLGESLQDCIRRGILMANFRVSTLGESIYVHFGDESHCYPRPDDEAIERIVEAFKPRVIETPDMPLSPLRVDEAANDG